MPEQNYDAIVVGSGISGGWAAKELTEKGLKVLMLERGKNIEHVKDYVNANKEAWDYPYRGTRTQKMEEEYPVLKRDYPLNEKNLDWWVKDSECPYTEVKRFDWFRGYHVGGRSLMWGRQSYRFSDFDFEANAKDGIAVDWPLRYAEIAPWYDYVEKFAGISGSLEGLPQLPDGQFLPPMEMTCVEKDVAARIKEHYKRQAHDDHRAHGQPDRPPRRPRQLPVPQQVLARLPVRCVLQHPVLYPARRYENGQPHAAPLVHRHAGAVRQRQQARYRGRSAGRRNQQDIRL